MRTPSQPGGGPDDARTGGRAPDEDAPTRSLPPRPGAGRSGIDPNGEAATVQMRPVSGARGPGDGPDPTGGYTSGGHDGGSGGGRRRRVLLVGAAVVGLLGVLYVGDLLVSATDVPRGVTVAGVPIGGMSPVAAEERLRAELVPRVERPVTLVAGAGPDASTAVLEPEAAGLELDVDATLAEAGEQPLNPFTRLTSLFSNREIAPVSAGNPVTVERALETLRPELDRPAEEGTIRFEGERPVPVPSRAGRTVDGAAASEIVLARWLDPAPVALPVTEQPVTVTQEGLDTALREVAVPAVAAPAYVVGSGENAELTPTQIGSFLRFEPDGEGGLTPQVDMPVVEGIVDEALGDTEAEARDASFTFQGTATTVVPAVTGRTIDYVATFTGLLEALGRPADPAPPPTFTPPPPPPVAPAGAIPATPAAIPDPPPATGRVVNAVYETTPPRVTTEELEALGPAEVIGEFRTTGFADDSGQNIRRAAEIVNGTSVTPGETFSLNAATGPRNASTGFVEAGIIEDGAPARGIAGGVSQFATTLYNASYFAGLEQVEHQEHSFYISRYPAGREATVFEGSIDLRFRNDGPTPVLITTAWTPSSIEVRIVGQKRYDVTSETGERTNPVPPPVRDLSANPRCSPSTGSEGFTITDTRVLTDVETGESTREPRTVRYEPNPIVTCGGAPAVGG